jgi:hypothetical protein
VLWYRSTKVIQMQFSNVGVIVLSCLFASLSVHKGYVFKTWTTDAKNGYHFGLLTASIFVLIEYFLSI